MSKNITLTGITPSGTPHLGNYIGAIKPAIASVSEQGSDLSFYFLSDYHSLVKCHDPATVHQSTFEVAATWLAFGLDPEKVIFYRQSDVPEIMELAWILACSAPKGLLNRAHAYKAEVDKNLQKEADPDKGITMGLFCYPVLMAADILMFHANRVPVGKDQIQHIEIARDIAGYFNHKYGKLFTPPEAMIDDDAETLLGLDGRKMSKSYNNVLPVFAPEKKLRKLVMKIKTNSLMPGEPKDHTDCILFSIYRSFATAAEVETMKEAYANGIAWGEAKQIVFECLNMHLTPYREKYEALIADGAYLEKVLLEGAEKARSYATPFLNEVRHAVGLRSLVK